MTVHTLGLLIRGLVVVCCLWRIPLKYFWIQASFGLFLIQRITRCVDSLVF